MDARLPAHIEVSALIRRVEAEGGFAMVIRKGERDAGTILVILSERGENSRLYERMPSVGGGREWHRILTEDTEKKQEFSDYVTRRGEQDRDTWIIELDIADGERFIGDLIDKG